MNKNGSADGKERATPNFQTRAPPPPRVVLSSSRYSTLAREIHRHLFRIKYNCLPVYPSIIAKHDNATDVHVTQAAAPHEYFLFRKKFLFEMEQFRKIYHL